MINFKKIIITIAMALLPFAAPAAVLAADLCNSSSLTTQQAIQCGTDNAAGQQSGSQSAGDTLDNTIHRIINILSAVVGVAAVVMIIIGGFRYITSAGNAESAKSARHTIIYAVIGLVVVALAQLIVRFTLTNATSDQTGNAGSSQPASCPPGSTVICKIK